MLYASLLLINSSIGKSVEYVLDVAEDAYAMFYFWFWANLKFIQFIQQSLNTSNNFRVSENEKLFIVQFNFLSSVFW
jgi:hypothetical protein